MSTKSIEIPYKIYLSEEEIPQSWYNVRADMKNKPAPLLNPGTGKPMTAEELGAVFCEELVEQELAKKELPLTGPGSLGLLEAELMKRLDVIERVGGELKKRWQHCVAQVLVRIYNHNDNDNETTN